MRTRELKPGFFKNEDLAELGPYAQLLFQGLWCLADREGKLEDRPRRIKAEVFPYYDPDQGVEELLQKLHDAGFILRYGVNGVRYCKILNFLKHQHPHPREAPSTIPDPPAEDLVVDDGQCTAGEIPCSYPDTVRVNRCQGQGVTEALPRHCPGISRATPRHDQGNALALSSRAGPSVPSGPSGSSLGQDLRGTAKQHTPLRGCVSSELRSDDGTVQEPPANVLVPPYNPHKDKLGCTTQSGNVTKSGSTPQEHRDIATEIVKKNGSVPRCPHQDIIALYHEMLPSLPRVKVWNGKREKALQTRWAEDPERQNLNWWKTFFEHVARSDFLMGRKSDWKADLEWLVLPSNFAKILNGRYHSCRDPTLFSRVGAVTLENLRRWMEAKEENAT